MSNLANPYQAPQDEEGLVGREPDGAGAFRVVNGDTLVAEKGGLAAAFSRAQGEGS